MLMAMSSGMAYAKSVQFTPNFSPESFTVSTSAGMLNGKSQELVYDAGTGRKVSQLDWKIKNTGIVKGELSWDPYSFLTLNARGWTSLASGSGYMDDYDWMNSSQARWTDHSTHPNTDVNYANEYDLSLTSWVFKNANYKAGVVAGYQETRFSWTATGGSYNYNNGTSTGDFAAGVPGVGYSQRFSMPYVGFTGQYRINDFEFNTLLKFSNLAKARGNDVHYLRDLSFNDKSTRSRYYGASVDAGYYIKTNTKVFAEFSYSKYEEGKGSTQIIDNNSGASSSIGGNAAGIANKNYTITAGLQYRF